MIIWKTAGFILGSAAMLATFLSVVITIYGPEKTYNKLVDILNDIFNSRITLQILFIVILATIVITAILCIKWIRDIKQQLSSEYKKNDDLLEEISRLLRDEKNLGILRMDLRNKYDNDTYKTIYRNTFEELIISGHSLNKTINIQKKDDLRDEFMNVIIRLVKNDRPVKILLLKINQSDELKNRRIAFDDFVHAVYKELINQNVNSDRISRSLLIKETDFLPYYIVKTESVFHIGHYTFGEYTDDSQKNMYIFEADSTIGYGRYCYEDFNSFFDTRADFITDYRNLFKRDRNG
jgi:hypothetical protein